MDAVAVVDILDADQRVAGAGNLDADQRVAGVGNLGDDHNILGGVHLGNTNLSPGVDGYSHRHTDLLVDGLTLLILVIVLEVCYLVYQINSWHVERHCFKRDGWVPVFHHLQCHEHWKLPKNSPQLSPIDSNLTINGSKDLSVVSAKIED